MTSEEKDRLYAAAQAHVRQVQSRVGDSLKKNEEAMQATEEKLRGPVSPSFSLERRLLDHKRERHGELLTLQSTPYFFRCDVQFQGETVHKTVYFSKHSFTDDAIYSWVAPAAALRFESPGATNYRLPDGKLRTAMLGRKDQYMIADGKITFMAMEDVGMPRELIHQEHFTDRKRGFVLPEIVAQMEKAQDQVIRAPYKGSYLIAGPAGSGKTTLALHRVAYLALNPDTAPHFPHEEIIVFVQDESSKAYFGALLLELGIKRATLCSFHEWALRLLKLEGHHFVSQWSEDDRENDHYFHAKKVALTAWKPEISAKDPFTFLAKTYAPILSEKHKKMFESQKKKRELDRFDIALLLQQQRHVEGKLYEEIEYYDKIVRGKLRKRKAKNSAKYALIIVDEAENWLAEELRLLRGCVDNNTQAIVYVGDLAQQTQLGTIRNWEDAGERFEPERKVILQKVYRNTRQILEYVRGQGFKIEIPAGIKSGAPLRENICRTDEEELIYCQKVVDGMESGAMVGILAKYSSRLSALRNAFGEKENVRLLSVSEAQGLEFDTVVLLDTHAFEAEVSSYTDTHLAEERKKMNRDLLYVALTRAMRELHIIDRSTS